MGRGLALEDRRQPVDALLLLGDNFYANGLERDDLVERLRENVVGPFCHFVELEGPRSPEVAGACREAPSLRHPIPLLVLFGNHDHTAPESPALQRETVPGFVSNWRVAEGPVQLVHLELAVASGRSGSEKAVQGAFASSSPAGDLTDRALSDPRSRFRLSAPLWRRIPPSGAGTP